MLWSHLPIPLWSFQLLGQHWKHVDLMFPGSHKLFWKDYCRRLTWPTAICSSCFNTFLSVDTIRHKYTCQWFFWWAVTLRTNRNLLKSTWKKDLFVISLQSIVHVLKVLSHENNQKVYQIGNLEDEHQHELEFHPFFEFCESEIWKFVISSPLISPPW